MKIFGVEIFSRKKRFEGMMFDVKEQLDKSKSLPDFVTNFRRNILDEESLFTWSPTTVLQRQTEELKKSRGRPKKADQPVAVELTPKGLFEIKWLNEEGFQINTDPAYLDEQIESFKEREALIRAGERDYRNGLTEIYSIMMRLENRKKYPAFAKFFEEYAYTKTSKINEVIAKNPSLKFGLSEQFVPSFPKEAVNTMKEYTKQVQALCGKNPVFYVIAKKEDFQRTDKRKDPILLAQSPFGHFWQILGAWDDEMIFLDDL